MFRTISANILKRLEDLPEFQRAHTVLIYHSLEDEVYTHEFIQKWSRNKRILLPVVKGYDLELRIYNGQEKMSIGSYGIKEPTGEIFNAYSEIDLAVIPGVAFDMEGNRLGRGKGYYDRFLPYIPSALKVAICFPFQIVEKVPVESFDVRMDIIITANENELSYTYNPLSACDGK